MTDNITTSAHTRQYPQARLLTSHTLHVLSPATRTFLAARSLCTKDLPARYFIPEATSLQKARRVWEVFDGTISPGLI